MKEYIKTITTPFSLIPFPKYTFVVGLLVQSLMFPSIQILLSLSQKFLVNSVEYNDPGYMRYVYILSAVILVMFFLINPLAGYIQVRSIRVFMKNFREYSVKKLLSFPYSFYENTHTGDLMTRLREDTEAVANIYTDTLLFFLLGIFYGSGSVILMTALSWRLAIVIVLLGVSETCAMAVISKEIKENSRIIQEITSRQNQLFFDIVKALSFIKMASLSRIMLKKYNHITDEAVNTGIERNKTIVALNLFNELFVSLNLLIVFSIGITMYFLDLIDLGSVMSFLILQDGISYMIYNLKGFFGSMNSQIVNYNRIFELLSHEDVEDAFEPHGERALIKPDDVKIENLSFHYGDADIKALDNLSCHIPKGRITVIYGPSGGGKSTLAKLLTGLYPLQSGAIHIGGQSYKNINTMALRGFFAYVPQLTYLFNGTVEANIRCGNEEAAADDVIKAAKASGAHDFIISKPLGYQTVIERHGSNFSGGEKQRIAIARAVLKDASTIIMDEATSAVDTENEAHIYDYAADMAKKGKTVIIISHRVSAYDFADNHIKIG